jgi:hypothetical protein
LVFVDKVLGYRAIENYLRLVLLAHLLLTHQALCAPDVQAELKRRHHVLRLASIPHLQQELCAAIWHDVVQRMEKHPKQRSTARKIKEFLRKCAEDELDRPAKAAGLDISVDPLQQSRRQMQAATGKLAIPEAMTGDT